MKPLLTIAGAALGILATPAAAQTFGPATTHPVPGARTNAAGDVNRDGYPDVLVASTAPGGFALWTGGPGGNLTSAPAPSVPFAPREHLLTDVDGDGELDIVAVNPPSSAANPPGEWVLLRGDGTGAFSAATHAGDSYLAATMTSGDVNGDGRVDVVIAGGFPARLDVYLGLGDGGFAPGLFHNAYFLPRSVSLVDLDGNATRDVVVCNGLAMNVSVFTNPGSGFLNPMVQYPTGTNTDFATAGDLDGDGLEDVLAAGLIEGPGVAVLRSAGDGTLQAPAHYSGFSATTYLASVDLDTDGRLDVVGCEYMWSWLRVFLGDGLGGLTSSFTIPTANKCGFLRFVDLDLDGRSDAVTTSSESGSLSIALQAPLTTPALSSFGTGSSGCMGSIVITGNQPPHVNTPDFAFVHANAPANSLGLCLLANAKDLSGSDPFGLGILLHVDLFAASEVFLLDCETDPAGVGRTAVAIPNDGLLAGATYYACVVHLENAADGLDCGNSPYSLVASRGLELTILP